MTSSWFFLSTLNYDARPTTHQMKDIVYQWTSVSAEEIRSVVNKWSVVIILIFQTSYNLVVSKLLATVQSLDFNNIETRYAPIPVPRCLRCGSAAARLLGLWVRIPPGAWMFVSCDCFVYCRVEVSASVWSLFQRSPTECGVSDYGQESSIMRRSWPTGDCCAMVKKNICRSKKMLFRYQ